VRLAGLLTAASDDPAISGVLSADPGDLDIVAAPPMRSLIVASAATKSGTVVAVTSTGREADDLADELRCLLPPDQVAVYPGWETLPHERLSPRADTVGRRLAVLRRLAHPCDDDPTTGPLAAVVVPYRLAARARAFDASTTRSRGAADVTSPSSSS